MLKAQRLIEFNGPRQAGGGFQIATTEAVAACMLHRPQRQFARQTLPAHLRQKVHLLQLADIGRAAGERRNTAATDHLALIFNNPVGALVGTVELKQVIQLGIGDGVALVSRQAELRRNVANHLGNMRIISGSNRPHLEVKTQSGVGRHHLFRISTRSIKKPGKPGFMDKLSAKTLTMPQ